MDGHLHGLSVGNVVDELDVLAEADVEVGGVDVDVLEAQSEAKASSSLLT